MSVRAIHPVVSAPPRSIVAHLVDALLRLLPARDSVRANPAVLCWLCGELAWTLDYFGSPLCRRCASI